MKLLSGSRSVPVGLCLVALLLTVGTVKASPVDEIVADLQEMEARPPVTDAVTGWQEAWTEAPTVLLFRDGMSLLDALAEEAEQLAKTCPSASLRAGASRFAAEVARTIEAIHRDGSPVRAGVAGFRSSRLEIGNEDSALYIDLEAIVRDHCRDPETCEAIRRDAARMLEISHSTFHVAHELLDPERRSFVHRAQLVNKRWEAYFTEARSQTPWELWTNSALFHRRNPEGRGFVDPPGSQWIWLHPTPAYELVLDRGERNVEMFGTAMLLEVIGFYDWTWVDGSADRKNRWGASFALSYAQSPNDDKVGIGFLLHALNSSFSLGGMWRDTEDPDRSVSVVLSADLWKAFSDPEKIRAALEQGR